MIKFRILIVTEDFPPKAGGCANRAYDFALKVKSPVVLTGKTERKKFPFKVHYFARSFKNPFEILFLPFFAFRLRKLIRDEGIDTVYVTSPPITLVFISMLVARMLRKKVVLDMRDLWYAQLSIHSGFGPVVWFVRALERYCVKRADLVYVLTGSMMLDFKKYSRNIILAYDGAKLKEIKEVKAKPQNNLITFIGVLYKVRDFSPIIESKKVLKERFPDLRLVFVGYGPMKQKLLNAGFDVKKPIKRRGAWKLMKESLAGIVPLAKKPGNSYQIPLKVYEYIAAGTPVIAWGPEGELKRFVKENEIGVWIDSGKELPSAIKKIRKNRAKFSRNCLKTARKHDSNKTFRNVAGEISRLMK